MPVFIRYYLSYIIIVFLVGTNCLFAVFQKNSGNLSDNEKEIMGEIIHFQIMVLGSGFRVFL